MDGAPNKSKTPLAGGALLAIAILGGAVAGVVMRQPSIGLVAGFGVGVVLLGLIWLVDRLR